MKDVKYNQLLKEAIGQLEKGAFLTTRNKKEVNVMTIAWGNIGFMWNRPVFTVMVRPSRHTYDIIDDAQDFTVSIPVSEDMQKAISYCGTYSGKDTDKIKDLDLDMIPGKEVTTPVVGQCSLHYECKIIAKEDLRPDCMSPEIAEKSYQRGDYHTLFYGEIVACYVKD